MDHEHSEKIIISPMARTMEYGSNVICGNILEDYGWMKLPKTYLHRISHTIDGAKTLDQIKTELMKDSSDLYDSIIDDLFSINYLCVAGFNNSPSTISIDITSNCNLMCKHCSGNFHGVNGQQMPQETIYSLADWATRNQVQHLSLSGGEPFMREDFCDILYGVRKRFLGEIEVLTNGTLIKESHILAISECVDIINISLDGYNEESVSQVRGKNVFRAVINSIKTLQKSGYNNISVSMVLTDNNQRNTDIFLKLCKELHVNPILRPLIYSGRALVNFQNTIISRNKHESRSRLSINKDNLRMRCICSGGMDSIAVSTDGRIYPCSTFEGLSASIGEAEDLIADKNSILSFLRPTVDLVEPCKDCCVKYFCSDICPAINESIYKNRPLREGYCAAKKEKLMKLAWGSTDH